MPKLWLKSLKLHNFWTVNPKTMCNDFLESYTPSPRVCKVSITPWTYCIQNTLPKSTKSRFGFLHPLGIKMFLYYSHALSSLIHILLPWKNIISSIVLALSLITTFSVFPTMFWKKIGVARKSTKENSKKPVFHLPKITQKKHWLEGRWIWCNPTAGPKEGRGQVTSHVIAQKP
jgi:hypothetical protein